MPDRLEIDIQEDEEIRSPSIPEIGHHAVLLGNDGGVDPGIAQAVDKGALPCCTVTNHDNPRWSNDAGIPLFATMRGAHRQTALTEDRRNR